MIPSSFHYIQNILHAEQVSLLDIATRFGTPTYVYSQRALIEHWQTFENALAGQAHLVAYAVKANSNLAVLNTLAQLGSGFDIVSGGELHRVLAAGGKPHQIIFSGVGKKSDEMRDALTVGIHCFNIESPAELERLDHIARELNCIAPIAIRVNPNITAHTHRYIATGTEEHKFGMDVNTALALYAQANTLKNIKIIGISCHIGSQITQMTPYQEALAQILRVVETLKSQHIILTEINMGGGIGVRYQDENVLDITNVCHTLACTLKDKNLRLILEPGRAICCDAGILLTQVEYIKENDHKNFAIVDAGMNDLIRPALYEAWHNIIPVKHMDNPGKTYDVVGPVCETGDFLGNARELNIAPQDFLAVMQAGAYGFVMSSNYNTRPHAAEVMVRGDQAYLVRNRETVADLFRHEHLLPEITT